MSEPVTPIEITDHKVNGVNEALCLKVMDEPGPGGAHHKYVISLCVDGAPCQEVVTLNFQKGGIAEAGPNGITNEVLLAVVKHRLQCFQNGPFACVENSQALDYVEAAVSTLHKRTLDRVNRGVEGTHQL